MATFTNQAVLSYNNTRIASNTVTGTIADTLSATKAAASASYGIGKPVAYAISLVNAGTAALTGLTVTDDLGAYEYGTQTLVPLTYEAGSVQYFVNGVLQPQPAVTAGDTLVITGISVPAGGNAVIVYQAVPNEFAPPAEGSEITNTATLSGLGVTAVSASATVPAETEAVLSIEKSLSPDTITGTGEITYTFTVRNAGNTAVSTAILGDTFDPVLDGLTAAADGVALTADDYTYDEATGVFETVSGVFTVPAATYVQDTQTGAYSITPGTVVITVTGTV